MKKKLFLITVLIAQLCYGSLMASTGIFSLEKTSEVNPKPDYSKVLQVADQYFDAELYEKACRPYQTLLHAIRTGDYIEPQPHVRYRLAQALFFSGDHAGVITLLNKNQEPTPNLTELYLLALAHGQLAHYEEAIENLELVLTASDSFPYTEEARFELALMEFKAGRLASAKTRFLQISSSDKASRFVDLSNLYLVRIALIEEHFEHAESLLDELADRIGLDEMLQYEWAYLYGETLFHNENYPEAISYFKQALPEVNPHHASWYADTLYDLGWSYLKAGSDRTQSIEEQARLLESAEGVWQQLLEYDPNERVLLALGQCYLTKARCLKDEEAYEEAEKILSRQDISLSHEGQAHVLLLRAEAAVSYEKRNSFYKYLTNETHLDTPYYARGWYLRGLNDFEEGLKLAELQNAEGANQVFENAIHAFKQAFVHLSKIDPASAGLALKYQAEAAFSQQSTEKSLEALSILKRLLTTDRNILIEMEDPDEIYYLYAQVASHLEQWPEAENALRQGLQDYPLGAFSDKMLLMLGTLHYTRQQYDQAEVAFKKLVEEQPASSLAGEALFGLARCADQVQDRVKSRDYKQQLFSRYPTSPLAAEAYFSYYEYSEYLQGDRVAVKHLQAFPEKFSDTPLLIHGWYLIGLDYKRDRKSPEGKWIRKKSLTAAIEAFQEAESVFDRLYEEKVIPAQDAIPLMTIRYQAMLERALANLNIADESQGAKKQIYLEYTQELLQELLNDFKDQSHPLYKHLNQVEGCLQIKQEATYWLAQTYIKDSDDGAAERILSEMLDAYRTAKITRGFFLSRAWYEQGLIAVRRKDYPLAFQCFVKAEDAAKGKILSTNQRLDLWIQQSLCHTAMRDFDNAILLLSKVINDDAISGLRIKAMYLRAELHELQGRPEVARRHFEATSKKGGEWALKAKEKLGK